MRALVYDRYGSVDVLELREVPRPEPRPGEVLVRVHAAALNPKDSFVRKGRFRALSGRRFPKYVGCDFAGEVAAVGRGVTHVAAGARVFGMLDEYAYRRGTVAEYAVARAREVAAMPSSLSFGEAAALPLVSLTALQALLNIARLGRGDRLCIHGASGGVGTAAIQIAKALGAHVTTTSSAANVGFCRELGADEALDYAADAPFSGARRFRVVLDAFGNQSLARVRRALDRGGVYVTTVPSARIVRDAARTLFGHPRARLVVVRPRREDLETVSRLVAEGRLHPVIDRTVALEDAISGIRHLETKRTRGKIVVMIGR